MTGEPAPSGTGDLDSVACANARCWAVGVPTGSAASVDLARTTDAGIHWSVVRVHVGAPVDLTSISCADPRHCMAVGGTTVSGQPAGAVLATADGGHTWTETAGPAGAVELLGVRCLSAAQCLVVATDGTADWSADTTDDGAVWQHQGDLPPGLASPGDIACPSAQDCMVAGYMAAGPGNGAGAIAVTTDGGGAWSLANLPSGTGLLHAVTCPTADECLAVGTTSTTDAGVAPGKAVLLESGDGGADWTALPASGAIDDAFGVRCVTADRCVVVGAVWAGTGASAPVGSVVTTEDAGQRWSSTRRRFVPVGLVAVDCATATVCVAAGDDVVARIDLPSLPRSSDAVAGGAVRGR